MKSTFGILITIFAILAVVALSDHSRADDIPATSTGTVTGHATDKDGKPLAKLSVRLSPAPKPPQQSQPHHPTVAESGADQPKPSTKPTPSGKNQTVVTDADGLFTFPTVPPGQYVLMATSPKAGLGKSEVHVDAGQTATVELRLEPKQSQPSPPPTHGGGGHAPGGAPH